MLFIILLFCVTGALASPLNGYSIIGGRNATKGEFPYITFIRICNKKYCDDDCGAVIVNENWILTAAHCKADEKNVFYQIIAGTTNLNDPNKQVLEAEKFISHEGYVVDNSHISDHDIALIKLSKPLVFNDLVQAVTLPKEDAEDPVGVATLAGWGGIGFDGIQIKRTDDLQTADLPIIDFKSCKEIIIKEGFVHVAPDYNDTIVCTGPMTGYIGACYGDSGGPLTQNGTLIGLTDWITRPCADDGNINIFTKVSSYLPWIFDTIAKN